MPATLHVGLDVGSTTVKVVAIRPGTGEVLYSRYERHNARQSETAAEFLSDMLPRFPGESVRVACCGSGGRKIADLIGASYVQEVVANAIAVRSFFPQASVAVELGGQDAKIVFFHKDRASGRLMAGDMRMNGSCAGGTGAFIDEIATLLRVPVAEFDALAARGTQVYDISGRCGVFAKTDIQPLLNQGGLVEDIALSAFHAIAKQTIGGLAQGLEIRAPVVFEGGPLTFNPTLVRVFAERLALAPGDAILPDRAELFIARGAALAVAEMFADSGTDLDPESALAALRGFRGQIEEEGKAAAGAAVGQATRFFESAQERAEFQSRHKAKSVARGNAGADTDAPAAAFPQTKDGKLRVYLGIDAGSTSTKFVLIDRDENVIDGFYGPNRGEPLKVIRRALLDLDARYRAAGIELEIVALGTTGYGELLFDKALGADFHTVETVAHAASALKYVPDASFILDIGGQDMKAIALADGVVTDITVNEACSSGCGSFLETFAETLGIPVASIADAAFGATNPAVLGSRCTVFMNSTIITEQRNGKGADDIMAGLCRSIVENVFTKVVRLPNLSALGDRIVAQGGTLRNDAVLRALEQYLGRSVSRAPYPGEMGAIGIALLTKREIERNGYTSPHGPPDRSRFIGFGALEGFGYEQEANLVCPFCANSCNRTLVRFSNGLTWVTGNRCERGEVVGDAGDPRVREESARMAAAADAVPDMVRERDALLLADRPFERLLPERGVTIGIPRALDFWRNLPFWRAFWGSLGFGMRLSRRSSRALYESGLQFVSSDTVCFPAKLVHGHIRDLIEARVDRIFFPQLNRLPPDNPERTSTFTCPVLKGYPLSVMHSDDPEGRHGIPLDAPVFHWFSDRDRERQLCRWVRETFGIDRKTVRAAIAQGDRAQADFAEAMIDRGVQIITDVEAAGGFAVVIAGRHYQYDEHVNHNLSRYFTGMGIPVLTLDSLPDLGKVPLDASRIEVTNNNHARLLSGAIFAAWHPSLEYVDIFSFGCGHDALYSDEIVRIMGEISGKAPLILKMDETDIPGPLRIRVRSFLETVAIRRAAPPRGFSPLDDPYPVKCERGDRGKTFLVPNASRAFCMILSAALRKDGLRAEPLPMGGAEAIAMGKRYVHNDMCLPAQIVIGEAILALKSGRYDPDNTIVGTAKVPCDCRLANYLPLARKALDEAGFPQVPIVTTDQVDLKNAHPGARFTPLTYMRTVWGLVQTDALEFLRRRIRPYELEKGETDRVVDAAFAEIADGIARRGISGSMAPFRRAIAALCAVRYDRSAPREPVAIQGEYLLVFHPGSNLEIERYLEANGMEVIYPRMSGIYRHLFLQHTIAEMKEFGVRHRAYDRFYALAGNAFMDAAVRSADRIAARHPLYEPDLTLAEKAKYSDHIMHHSVISGESFLIAADILHYAERGVRSFVVLQPFGCLPNHVCGRGIMKRVKEAHPDIMILPLDYDPDVSFANVENRLQMLIMNARATPRGGGA